MGKGAMPLFRILVVDDFESFRRFVCSVLQQREEFQVTEASNGLEAVQKAEELQPDLILLDIGLPNLNGLEVAKRVRKLAPAAKILFVSQESSPDVVREALSLGALGYVHKPRCQTDLLPAIEAVLRGKPYVGSGLEFGTDTPTPHRHEVVFCSGDGVLLDAPSRFIAAADSAQMLATQLSCWLPRRTGTVFFRD
jgi:DNA-binding NarL/FixJ family response regulator